MGKNDKRSILFISYSFNERMTLPQEYDMFSNISGNYLKKYFLLFQ